MLQRRLSLLQAVSLNMGMMVGVGPFITIPAFLGKRGRAGDGLTGYPAAFADGVGESDGAV